MKATLEIDDDLYRQLKATAAMRGKKIRELITEGARMVLRTPTSSYSASVKRVKLPLIDSGRPGKLNIPDDIVSRMDTQDDLERHEALLRQ
jgi:hypothetical protein